MHLTFDFHLPNILLSPEVRAALRGLKSLPFTVRLLILEGRHLPGEEMLSGTLIGITLVMAITMFAFQGQED